MLPEQICRTCALHNVNLVALATRAENYASKSLYDILRELTQLDLCLEHAEEMPHAICKDCCQRLKSSYDFVLQAQQANEQLLAKLRLSSQTQCLDETPIDIPIKTEIDIDEERPMASINGSSLLDTQTEAELKWQAASDSESEQSTPDEAELAISEDDQPRLRRSLRRAKSQGVDKSQDTDSEDDAATSPGKRRRGRPPRLEKTSEAVRHACDVCGKTFSWHRDMQRHARIHFEQASYICDSCGKSFLRKDKYTFHLRSHEKRDAKWQALQLSSEWRYAERLYSSARLKRIECKLCGLKCQRIQELRQHLASHAHLEALQQLTGDSEVVTVHFSDWQLAEIKQQVCADIAAQRLDKYCAVVNAHGYELCLSDSDEEELAAGKPKYYCLPCNLLYKRKHRLMRHTLEEHTQSPSLPTLRCESCQIGFVCPRLLEQHVRTQCGNKLRRYQCSQCPGRFMWPQNLERHACCAQRQPKQEPLMEQDEAAETAPAKRRSKRSSGLEDGQLKLQCDACEKVFVWAKDLTRHKRMHQPETAQFECAFCERRFHRKDGLKSHLRVHGEELNAPTNLTQLKLERMPVVLTQLCRPHGCKEILCMICQSRHSKIFDLRTHLRSHQHVVNFEGERATLVAIEAVSRALYPELEQPLAKQPLSERIMADVAKGEQLERFYSITNEAGCELSLDSSETESEEESEGETESDRTRCLYTCDLCRIALPRKHELYAHQLELHEWQQADHVCAHCHARFVSAQLLDHHLRSLCRNTQKRLLCRKCPLRFRWKDNLKLHTSVAHQECKEEATPTTLAKQLAATSFDCAECKRSFKMQKDLTRHTLMHAQESSIYRCRWCARRFYRLANLLQHIERHGISAAQLPYAEALINANRHPHGRKVIMCKVCELRFETIAALRAHLREAVPGTHHDYNSMQNYSITNQLGYELQLDDSETEVEAEAPPRQYICGMCQLRCNRKYELYQHQQAMHRLERIGDGCDLCVFKCVAPALVEHHRRGQCGNTEKQFKCAKCSYKFMWEANLLLHMQLQHGSQAESGIMELEGESEKCETRGKATDESSVSKLFQCNACPRKYNRKDRLTAHIKKCHAPGAPPSQPPNASTKAPTTSTKPLQKRFLCAFCGKAMSSSSNLIAHMRRHTGEKPFKCEYCEMGFPRSSDLQCHRRTHTGERPHVCTVCQKSFARSYKLQQHMRIHNGERPYKCSYCEKSFTQSNDLTLHIRRHTGERPYQCGICGERFIQGTALKNHRLQQGHYEVGQNASQPARRTVLEQFGAE